MKAVVVGGVAGGMSFAARAAGWPRMRRSWCWSGARTCRMRIVACLITWAVRSPTGMPCCCIPRSRWRRAWRWTCAPAMRCFLSTRPGAPSPSVTGAAAGSTGSPTTCWCCPPGPRRSSRRSRGQACRGPCAAHVPDADACARWWTGAPAGGGHRCRVHRPGGCRGAGAPRPGGHPGRAGRQVLPPLDPEMARSIEVELARAGVGCGWARQSPGSRTRAPAPSRPASRTDPRSTPAWSWSPPGSARRPPSPRPPGSPWAPAAPCSLTSACGPRCRPSTAWVMRSRSPTPSPAARPSCRWPG